MNDDYHELWPWIDAVNKRGISGLYTRDCGNAISEDLQLSSWMDAVEAKGERVTEPSRNPKDPPDFWVKLDGNRIGVEVTELVDQEFLSHNEKSPEAPWDTSHGVGFERSFWTEEKFAERVGVCIRKKGDKYTRNRKNIDVLAIVCGECGLYERDVQNWLPNVTFPKFQCIGRVDLVLNYRAGALGYHPVFWLT